MRMNESVSARMKSPVNMILLILLFFICSSSLSAQSASLDGQASFWSTITSEKLYDTQIGLRYLPTFSIQKPITNRLSLDAEMSCNAYTSALFHTWDDVEKTAKIKPYRIWFRLATSQFEARLGLQKITFGQGALLRPLMWFDRIDPRDPLQITEGVYGLLLRYYFLNNTNIWIWGLYGNDETKGWEFIASDPRTIEYGGRIQVPLFKGELALTYHHRRMDLGKGILDLVPIGTGVAPENRLGLDGKWDIGIGFWFEGVLVHQKSDCIPFSYTKLLLVGLDYTFGIGNGLHVMNEYFHFSMTEKIWGAGDHMSFSALSLNYPFGLIDRMTGMVYYDWENHGWYRFVDWQRTYDRWIIHVMAFWNPDQFQIYFTQSDTGLFSGKGIQVMVVFNH